jgi:hypothetical protein
MHRSLPAGSLFFVAALLLAQAACDGGDGAGRLAAPDELQIRIVEGDGMRTTVRPFGEQPADSLVVRAPVVVRVSVAPDAEEGDGITEPSGDVRLPPVTMHWRTLDPFCQVVSPTTQVAAGNDTSINHYVRPVHDGICHLEVAATVEGRPIGRPDTAAVHVDPGPPVRMVAQRLVGVMPRIGAPFAEFAPALFDAHDNSVVEAEIAYAVSRGAPNFFIEDGWVRATGEGYGEVTVTVGSLSGKTEAWGLELLGLDDWRLSWECYDMQRAGGVRVDSVHFSMDRPVVDYGSFSARGVALGIQGTLVRREWVHGEPVHETQQRGAQVFTSRKPGIIEWSPGQVAQSTPRGFEGGTLCRTGPAGEAWGRTSPVLMLRL